MFVTAKAGGGIARTVTKGESIMKRLLSWLLNHKCWLGVPHKDATGTMIMECYECGRTQPVRVDLEAR